MIVQQEARTVISNVGRFFFTKRNGNRFEAVSPTEVIYCDDGWAFLTPKTIEVCGDYILDYSPRSIPVLVDADYINRQLEAAEEANGEMSWALKQEIDSLLQEF